MNYQDKVLDFQIAGGEDLNSGLTPLREALLKEEIQELEDAIKANDRVEILDALCDIKYINDGNANLLGVDQDDYFINTGEFSSEQLIVVLKEKITFNHYVIKKDFAIHELANLFNFTLDNFKTALERVHLSNMSKFCSTEQEAIETIISYERKGIDTYCKQNGDKWVVYRKSDNKILKSILYTPVDLKDLV